MERFVKGDVVITPFPFSDLSNSIKRPALVIATLKGDDVILCQITKKERSDPYKTDLILEDFKMGGLKINSFIRPSRLFTIRKSIILYKSGKLNNNKIKEVEDKIVEMIRKE